MGALGLTLLLWASAFAGIRAALPVYSPGQLALLRFLVASALLGGYVLLRRSQGPSLRDAPRILLAGFLGITVYHLALNYGEKTVTAGSAALLVNTAPVFTALLATAFLGERLGAWGWLGILISFTGASLIALGERQGLNLDPGAALLILSAVAFSLYAIIQKPYLRRFSPLGFAAYTIWAGTLFMLPFLPGLVERIAEVPVGTTLAGVYLGVFPSALAYVTWAYALSRVHASRAASSLYLVSPIAILIAWVWLGEVPSTLSLVGGVIAITGVALVSTLGRQKR